MARSDGIKILIWWTLCVLYEYSIRQCPSHIIKWVLHRYLMPKYYAIRMSILP